MSYTTRDIYDNKTDRELYRIFSGAVQSTIIEKEWAEKILKERDFEFRNVEQYRDKWELEKLLKEVETENTGLVLMNTFYSPKFCLLYAVIMLVYSIFFVSDSIMDMKVAGVTEDTYFGIGVSVISFFGAIALARYSRQLKRKQSVRKARIAALSASISGKS